VANLYRPGNQTRAVILSLGFGAFLISALYLVQVNLLRQFDGVSAESRGNLLLFDIQEDQAAGVDSIVAAGSARVLELTPIVTMRIAAINGRTVRELIADGGRGGSNWPLRREYRSTFADSIEHPETITAGPQFGVTQLPQGFAEVSFESEVAREMLLTLGDTVVWDVQGVNVATIVTSLREVNWGRLETNFFAVFGPASIQSAPKQFALLARVPEDVLGTLQGRIVDRYANVSAIDLTLVGATIAGIQNKVSVAIRFTALFSLAMGIPVLLSAVAATRRERVREGVLLRTLGATRAQVRKIMLSEYAILGTLGTLTGVALGAAGAWGVMWYIFGQPYLSMSADVLLVGMLMIIITMIIGFAAGRDAFRATPAAALRD
jgi:putative ABC transport system permease protein